MDVEAAYRRLLEGRRVVIAGEVLAGARQMVETLYGFGVESVAVLYATEGAGEAPEDVTAIRMEMPPAEGLMAGIRAFHRRLAELPPETLDPWDPDRSALFLAGPFDQDGPIAGRQSLGGRPDSYVALEDKTTVDELWDRARVPRAPSRVVPARRDALVEAATELDWGLGTVWVADNREGWHGGGDYLRWVREPGDVDDAVAFLARHAHRARVMPFLDGIPCSIHGMVIGSRIAVFRPAEMLILRPRDGSRLQYAGISTAWDPRPEDREEMRAAARRVGTVLREEVGYRGLFGIDGIMTAEGFRPTELNPRFTVGAGLQGLAAEVHLGPLNRLVMADQANGLDPDELEGTVVEGADARRQLHCIVPLAVAPPEWSRIELRWDGARWAETDGDDPDGTLHAGPHPMGAALRLEAKPERTPPGPPFGPRVVAAIDLARSRGVAAPEVDPAQDVRRS